LYEKLQITPFSMKIHYFLLLLRLKRIEQLLLSIKTTINDIQEDEADTLVSRMRESAEDMRDSAIREHSRTVHKMNVFSGHGS